MDEGGVDGGTGFGLVGVAARVEGGDMAVAGGWVRRGKVGITGDGGLTMIVIQGHDAMTCSGTAGEWNEREALTVRRRVAPRAPWSGISTAAPYCTPFWRFVVVNCLSGLNEYERLGSS